MRLRHIEVFHAIYSTGSVTRAAQLLSVSQPSVSKVLAHAEQQLGYPLFDRVKGKLVPTPEADRLYAHVLSVNNSVHRLRQVAANLAEADQGRIRIAATPAFGLDVLPAAIASWRRAHNETWFSVETLHHDAICSAVLESSIDIGLVFAPPDVPGIEHEVLATASFVVLAPEGMEPGNGPGASIDDIGEHPFIQLDHRGPLGQLLSERIAASSRRLNVVAKVETYHVAKALAAHGAGVTITDPLTALASGHEGLQAFPLQPELPFTISALHLDSAPVSQLCRRFLDHLRAHMQDLLGGGK